MAPSLKISECRLETVNLARSKKGWTKRDQAWCQAAATSESTLKRFWQRQPIKQEAFVKICEAVGVNWEDVVDDGAVEPTEQPTLDQLWEQLKDRAPRTADMSAVGTTKQSTLDQLWKQLTARATLTDQMGPVLAQPGQTLNMWEPETQYLKEVPVRSRIKFEVNLERDGYLVLLEKGTSGQLWCLCPSFLAPQPQLSAGPVQLPQETGRHKYFTLTGDGGKEEMIALIAKEPPPLNWLPKGDQPPLQMNDKHLMGLLEYLKDYPDSQVLYTEYEVTV